LKKLPGLGRKTAERLCMELADKLDDITPAGGAHTVPVGGALHDDVILALVSLGMTKHSAQAALDRMNWRHDDGMSVEDVVREALRYAGNP
jgi:Holliday junction DNA helicase RuvA